MVLLTLLQPISGDASKLSKNVWYSYLRTPILTVDATGLQEKDHPNRLNKNFDILRFDGESPKRSQTTSIDATILFSNLNATVQRISEKVKLARPLKSNRGSLDIDKFLWFQGGFMGMQLTTTSEAPSLALRGRKFEPETDFGFGNLDPILIVEGYTDNFLIGTLGGSLVLYELDEHRQISQKSVLLQIKVRDLMSPTIFEGPGKKVIACFLGVIQFGNDLAASSNLHCIHNFDPRGMKIATLSQNIFFCQVLKRAKIFNLSFENSDFIVSYNFREANPAKLFVMRFFLEKEVLRVTSMPLEFKGIGMVWEFSISVSNSGIIYVSALLGMY